MASDNEELLAKYPGIWSSHDKSAILDCFTDDCVYEDPSLDVNVRGKQELIGFIEMVFSTLPDFHLEYPRYFANARYGAAEWIISGTFRGKVFGRDATGRKVRFAGATLFEFHNGRISRNTDHYDHMFQLEQLGVIPEELRRKT
jgi:steroid delta-isomerase-like uncharacterized protein